MDISDQLELEHILFFERKCRTCGIIKSLLDDFYLTRRDRGSFPSAYSYECKECTKSRILKNRKKNKNDLSVQEWQYPDW